MHMNTVHVGELGLVLDSDPSLAQMLYVLVAS